MLNNILFIDDNESDYLLMREFLDAAGFQDTELIKSLTGEDGVEKAREIKPDLVICDTQLPGIDGFEACKKIKQIDAGKIKVVVVTGYLDSIDAVKAKDMGADDYAVKTHDFEQLMDCVRNISENKEGF